MNSSELSGVAWDLVEHVRAELTIAELNAVFVRLGVDDYTDAIEIMLKSIVRAGGPPVPDRLLAGLSHVGHVHELGQDFVDLLARVPRAGTHHPPSVQ